MGWAQALLLAGVTVAACGKSGAGATGDAGVHGPTDLVVKWTFTGKPASAAECAARMGQQVDVTMSGTIDPALHKTVTTDCAKGTVDLGSLLVEDLGAPYLEATLLDAKGMTVTIAGVNVTPILGTTTVTFDFFPAVMGTGGAGGTGTTASSVASTAAASSGGGAGGATSSSSAGSTSASSASSSSGGKDAGTDGG